jgi:MYXO-CTERM domain-containing protein
MDFIERIFEVSPDGGSGALEAIYLMVLGLGVAVAGFLVRRRRSARDGRWHHDRRA